MVMYKKTWFKSKGAARVYQKKIKTEYGYRPSLFILPATEKKRFFVVKPYDMKKLQ
jgi:hypothetical protein